MNDTITITLSLPQAMRILEALDTQIGAYTVPLPMFNDEELTTYHLWKLMLKETEQAKNIVGAATAEATKDL